MSAAEIISNIRLFFRIYDCNNGFWFCFYFSFNENEPFKNISQSVTSRLLKHKQPQDFAFSEMYYRSNEEIVLIKEYDTPKNIGLKNDTIVFFKSNYFEARNQEKPYFLDDFKFYDSGWMLGIYLAEKKPFRDIVKHDIQKMKEKIIQ